MEIQHIKQRLSITTILNHYGLQSGKNHRLHCPFHNDKTPSMQVYPKTNTVYCFSGNCPQGGKPIDQIDFIMHKENITKHQALVKATEMVEMHGHASGPAIKPPTNNGTTVAENYTKIFQALKNQLPRSKNANEYLKKRNLEKLKEIGSNHRGSNNSQPYWYNQLKNCIVFPLKDKKGTIASLYGRSFTNSRNGHYYLPDRKGLYPGYPNPDSTKIILTESIIDAATLLLHGNLDKNTAVLACYGTNGLTPEHLDALKEWYTGGKEIIFFFDGDTAGTQAMIKYEKVLAKLFPLMELSTVITPDNEDINSLLDGHGPEILGHLLEQRVPVIKKIEKGVLKNQLFGSPKTNNTPPAPHLQAHGRVSEHLHFNIKGSVKNLGDSLKATIQSINKENSKSIIQKLDLYDFTALEKHAKQASKLLGLETETILIEWQQLAGELEKESTNKNEEEDKNYQIDQSTREKCTGFLKSINLLDRINDAIGKTGVVGEEKNRLLLFLIAISYQSGQPLHGLIQGSSGSGKTKLLQSIYSLIPAEDYKSFTRVTESSFYNYNENSLKNKLLCFEDIDGLKEEALLALRELQSNGKLISSTAQKLENGKIQSMERIVKGPVATLSCTTRGDYYEDNISRSFVVAVDESAAQTAKIIDYQNSLATGEINTVEIEKTKTFIANCLRMLQPLKVVNPYASKIKLPQSVHKLRRLHGMYQVLVAQITYLHQYQRKKDKMGRLVSEKQDLQYACDILLDSILLKIDEMDGSLRQFYESLKEAFKDKGKEFSFNRFDVKAAVKLGTTQTRKYLEKLVELEYLQQFGFANRGYRYKIAYRDEYQAMKAKIKKELQEQINQL